MKYILYSINSIFVLLMVAVAVLFVVPMLPIQNNIQLRIVESGSMEPSIMTGAVVMIVPQSEYKVGDVITFANKAAKVPTTHRIAETYRENGQTWFVTKGDANEDADTAATAAKDVLGKAVFDVPYAGYVLDFSRQPLGFLFLIVLPALMIVFGELEKIWTELRRKREGSLLKNTKKDQSAKRSRLMVSEVSSVPVRRHDLMIDIGNPVRYQAIEDKEPRLSSFDPRPVVKKVARRKSEMYPWSTIGVSVIFSMMIVGTSFISSTVSYFNDIETSVLNALTATAIDFKVLPDGEKYSFGGGFPSGSEDESLVTIVTPLDGSADIRYNVAVAITGGKPALCDAIHATSSEPFSYSGPLTALLEKGVSFDDPWVLDFGLASEEGLSDEDICTLDIIYTAWHNDTESDQGYFDEERTPLSFVVVIEPSAQLAEPTLQAVSAAPLSLEVDEEVSSEEEPTDNSGDKPDVPELEPIEEADSKPEAEPPLVSEEEIPEDLEPEAGEVPEETTTEPEETTTETESGDGVEVETEADSTTDKEELETAGEEEEVVIEEDEEAAETEEDANQTEPPAVEVEAEADSGSEEEGEPGSEEASVTESVSEDQPEESVEPAPAEPNIDEETTTA